MQEIVTSAMPALVTALGGLLAWFLKEQHDAKRRVDDVEETLIISVTMILKNQLVAAHRSALTARCISITERDTFLQTFNMYEVLQGKPSLSHLHDDILRLPLAEGEK